MSAEQLRPGWRQLPFSEIAMSITERVDDPAGAGVDRYVGLEHLDTESTIIRRWGSPDDVASTKLRFYPGDVVYGRRRAYQRKLGVADFEGICSAHALVLRARPETCLPEFLPYFLQSDAFHERAVGISVGSLSPTINWKTLAKEEFALPPLDEQKRIVELLATAQLSLQKAVRAADASNELLLALTADLVKCHPQRPLVEVADILDSRRVPLNDSQRSTRRGTVPYYGAQGVVDFVDQAIFDETLVLVPEDQHGGFFSLWKTKPMAQLISGPAWVNNHAHVLRATEVPSEWLFYCLVHRDLRELVNESTRSKLNRRALEKITIPCPSDLDRRLERLKKADQAHRLSEAHARCSVDLVRQLREASLNVEGP